MVIKNLKSTYKKLILISFYFIIAAILWKIFEEILIFIFSILIFLFYIVIYKIFKLIQFRIKKVPGAGINLKLTLAFISITSIPLFVMVFLTFDLTNQFIESAFHQPFGQYLERLKTLSTEKLSKDFNNYIKIISNTIDIDGINLNKRNYNIEKRFHNFVNFNLIDFYIFFYYNHNKIIISSNRLKINPIKEIENNYKRYLNGDLKRQFFKMLDDKNLFNKKISMIDDKLQINYYIKIVNKEKNHYLFLAKYINPIDLEMAENIKFFYGSYHLKEFNKEQAISNFKWIIFLVGAPTLIVALLFSFFLARSLLKPIESLIIGTKEVANGNLSYKIKELKRGELGELIHSFNYMTHELLKNKRQLYYIEKVAAWREVAKRLAHEIKNPLTPIKLAIERLKKQYIFKNENYSQILENCSTIIISEVERLRNLVNEFSEFARLPKIHLRQENIIELIEELFTIYKTSHTNVIFNLKYNLPTEFKILLLDKEKIKQVFINLVENGLDAGALKFNFTVSINRDTSNGKDLCQISVQDNGKGISQENISQLFRPYYSTKQNSSGLGLSIVKNIIEEHRGHIYIQSVEGKETTILLELPYY